MLIEKTGTEKLNRINTKTSIKPEVKESKATEVLSPEES